MAHYPGAAPVGFRHRPGAFWGSQSLAEPQVRPSEAYFYRHALFVLREEQGGWGVGIPPGMAEQTGRLHEIADHDDMVVFQQQIVEFRRWMKERGQQEKALIVTEYGILMPTDYGFPANEVKQFMLGTFEFLRTAADPEVGYPSDGYRLVQRWCWFSLSDPRYPTGNLLQLDSQLPTPLGEAFRQYASKTP